MATLQFLLVSSPSWAKDVTKLGQLECQSAVCLDGRQTWAYCNVGFDLATESWKVGLKHRLWPINPALDWQINR
jgi:hypothetical protein